MLLARWFGRELINEEYRNETQQAWSEERAEEKAHSVRSEAQGRANVRVLQHRSDQEGGPASLARHFVAARCRPDALGVERALQLE